jgi:hypothetical protein
MRRFSSFALFLAVPVVALAHCGGSNATNVGGGDDAGDASLDGAATGDATASDGAGSDGSTSGDDGSTLADTATGDDGADGDGSACGSNGGTRAACVTCCTTAHPQGAESLASDELACACTPEDCGSLEGGPATPDAGTGGLGTGACSAECAMPGHNPGATCDVCLRRSVGSMTAHGPCYTQVSAACEADDACKAYAACELTCPAN